MHHLSVWKSAASAAALVIVTCGAAQASTVTIGTITGSGTVVISPAGSGTVQSFSLTGGFAFDPSLKSTFGDVGQFQFQANSTAFSTVDGNGVGGAVHSGANANWQILNTTPGNQNSMFYGTGFTFNAPNASSGSLTASLTSDGFVHWYYGYDTDLGGETPLSVFGATSSVFGLGGTFTTTSVVTGANSQTVKFDFSGAVLADTSVPEPTSLALAAAALLGLGLTRRKAGPKA